LFSSAAAAGSNLSVGNTIGLGINVGDNVAANTNGVAAVSTEESYNVKYGPGK
jgi:hypothetical protein